MTLNRTKWSTRSLELSSTVSLHIQLLRYKCIARESSSEWWLTPCVGILRKTFEGKSPLLQMHNCKTQESCEWKPATSDLSLQIWPNVNVSYQLLILLKIFQVLTIVTISKCGAVWKVEIFRLRLILVYTIGKSLKVIKMSTGKQSWADFPAFHCGDHVKKVVDLCPHWATKTTFQSKAQTDCYCSQHKILYGDILVIKLIYWHLDIPHVTFLKFHEPFHGK